MSFNGSGTFLINTAGQPVVAGTVISSTAFNALTADLATGLSTAITKDGQTTVTANIPMSTYKFTGLGVGSAATDSANLSQVQSTVTKLLTSVSGTDTITAVGAPVVAAYAAGQMFYFVATGDNTGAVTLNIDSLGAKAVTRDGSVALAAGDIKSGEVVVVVYDGTRFQVVSQLNSAGNATFANVSITSALNVGGVATLSGNLVFNSTAQRITADMSNATVSNRFAFQTSTTNGNTQVNAIPNGTSTTSQFIAYNNADSNNASSVQLAALSTATRLLSGQTGTGSYLPLTFFTNGSEQARIDTSGNLGLGVTPSAWISSWKVLEQSGVSLASSNTIGIVGQNWWINSSGSDRYLTTAAASIYKQTAGAHSWSTAPSGTAGNGISFTQAMTLDASGNLQLGTTTNKTTAFSGNGTGMTIGASLAPMIALWDTSAATNVATLGQIDADTYLTNSANGVMVFSTSNTERARITSGGALCVNSTSNIGSEITLFKQTAGSGTPVTRTWNNETSGNNEFIEFATETSYTNRGSITYNRAGGLVAYNTTSDYRAKDILGPVQNSGATIDALKVYEGQMKGATQSRPMLVAHEAQEHAPYAVTGEKDAVNEDGTPKYQQMDVSALVPLLLAEIQSLRARVAQLESK